MPNTIRKATTTDWERVKREAAADAPIATDPDEPYDPNNAQAVSAHWNDAHITRSRGRLNMRVDGDVLEAFKATGAGWQNRINAVLRDAVMRGALKT
jgi:uncharacterized protein (DUF4415 family)